VKNELKEKSNWTDSDELALMFRNTYAPAFYKQLHRYVHKTYRRQLALQQIKKIARLRFFSFRKAMSYFYYAPAAWMDRRKLRLLEMPGHE
jgi:hypothetical protein